MDHPPPPHYSSKRYMKIDNRTSMSSIKNVIQVLYQLLSIDSEDVGWIDIIGLVQFMLLVLESVDISIQFEVEQSIKRQLFQGPDSLQWEEKEEWKEIRKGILDKFYNEPVIEKGISEKVWLEEKESLQNQLRSCYEMIRKLMDVMNQYEHMDPILPDETK